MNTVSALKAKNAFVLMINAMCAEPALINKHDRVVLIIANQKYARSMLQKRTRLTATNRLTDASQE